MATLGWIAIVTYRKPLMSFISNRKFRVNLMGQEVEFGEQLDQLEKSAEAAEAEVAKAINNTDESSTDFGSIAEALEIEKQVLREAARSPRAALMLLSSELERMVRHTLLELGQYRRRFAGLMESLDLLTGPGYMAAGIASSIREYNQIRDEIVHGHYRATNEDILRAIDSGLTILRSVAAIPRERHYVHHANVPVFSDAVCSIERQDCTGVILRSVSPAGTSEACRIFPTTRIHFKPGVRVAWEWNGDSAWGSTWYRDPDTLEISHAWESSAEFIGRSIEES